MIEQLHFVRPMFFYGFIPLIILLIVLYRHHGSSMNWKSVCDAKLMPYILSQGTNKSSRFPLFLAAIAASLCITAAAGPAFEKLPKPVFREQSTLVILMDLSQSMDASDIKPTRLERAKLKLLDILKARKAGQTALIVYAADAFTVTPLTDDTNTIASMVPTLETGMMPSQGSNTYTAINKSIDLLQQAGASSGDVLLIGDDIGDRDIQAINKLTAKGHRLSILGVGTQDGSPISVNGGFLQDSSGAIVIAKLDTKKLSRAALTGGGLYTNLQADDSDTNTLNKLFSSRKVKQNNEDETIEGMELTADIWQEEGPWLLLFVIPLVALWARKGWILCFTIIVLPVPQPAYALDFENLWSSPDQKAMSAFKEGDSKTASEQFQNKNWKASALYRSGDYEKSIEAMQAPTSSDDFYNKGNALAQMGSYPEAVEAYDEALNLDANNEDANFNREQVKKLIEQQKSEDKGDENGEENEDGEKSEDSKQGDQENKDQQEDSEQDGSESQQEQDGSESEDKQQSEQKENKEQSEGEQDDQSSEPTSEQQSEQDESKVEQAIKDAQENDSQAEEQESQQIQQIEEAELSEDDQATEQWLKRVPDNPELLLKRKFHYQYKNMQKKTPSEQSW